MGNTLRLMTHNVWNFDANSPKWAERGEDCSAAARVGGLLRVYRETLPDVIGGQEVSALMADLLCEGFQGGALGGVSAQNPRYTLIWGRFTPIIYRSDRLELLASEFGTYPETIDGFEGKFNDVKSKSWNLGVFRVKESGATFIFVTTHLWWMHSPKAGLEVGHNVRLGSDEARERQIAIVLEKIASYRAAYGCPAVLVGDMNTDYNSLAMRYVRANGFRHAHDIATDYREESIGLHYCFADGYKTQYYDWEFERAIDHIYVADEAEGAVKRFERYSPDYYFPISDHSAAYMDIQL